MKNQYSGLQAHHKLTLFVGTALATALCAGAALAQAPEQPQSSLETVVVTAQRTEQRLQDVPMSVTAITQHQLEIQGVTSGEALNGMVPNLVVGSNNANGIDSTVSIRGIPEVGLYVDGIWQPDIGFRESGIVEMDRVEILRGPQGTLFGRNTNGGAINYVTSKPSEEYHVNGGVEIGSFAHHYANVSVDIPISDKLLTKWTVAVQDQGGWAKSLVNGEMYGGLNNNVFRGDVLWKPSPDFSLRLTASEDDLIGTPDLIERFNNLQTVGSKGQNISNVYAYNIAMQNPAYGPYSFNTGGTPWISRFGNGNVWNGQQNGWNFPGGSMGKWQNDETEPLNSEQEYTNQYTATATWNITPHMKFTNLAGYVRQYSYHFDNDPAAPVYQWDQLRQYLYQYASEEAHLEGDFFNGKVSYLAGFYYLYTRQRTRTYSWAYQEFYTPSNPGDPVLEAGNNLVLDPALSNFIHAWGAANASTALGRTIDPSTGKTIASEMAVWKPNLTSTGMQPANATDFTNMMNDNRNHDYSVFLNVTYHPWSKLDLQGGLRGAWNNGLNQIEIPTGAYRNFNLPMTGGGTGYGPGPIFGSSGVAQTLNPYPGGVTVTPMATVTYHWTPDVNTFFRFAQGYTTGSTSFNAVLNQNITLQPEQVYDYEAGLRSDWFEHRLRANLTGYFMIWRGKQVSSSFIVNNALAVVTTSGGESRAMGFEGEIDAVPVKGLTLQLTLANLDTRWLNSGTLGYPPGLAWSFAPKWTYHLSGQYDYDLSNGGTVTLRADYGHQSHYQRDTDPGRQLLVPEPGYGLLNARIQYAAKGGRWNVQFWATNLTDVAYVDGGTGSPYTFGVDAADLGQRRMLGVRLNFNY